MEDLRHDSFVRHYSRAYRELFRHALMLAANVTDADDAHLERVLQRDSATLRRAARDYVECGGSMN